MYAAGSGAPSLAVAVCRSGGLVQKPVQGGAIEKPAAKNDGMDTSGVTDVGSRVGVEHYEICRYGTLVEWAKDLGHDEAARLLGENLKEERHADTLLTEIARASVNKEAQQTAA